MSSQLTKANDQMHSDIAKLKAINAELLAALELAAAHLKHDVDFHDNETLRDALAKAKGE